MKPNQFKALQKTFNGLLLTEIGFAVVVLSIVLIAKKTISQNVQLDRALQLIALLFAIASCLIGFRLYKKRVLELRAGNLSAQEKMDGFKKASVVFWRLINIPALFCGICYVITGNFAFMALYAFLLFAFGAQNPFKSKVALLLNLSASDIAALDGSGGERYADDAD
ncbi:hypothetical protein [Pinibacter soli]|uniref:DUF3278 domain-containing protein n=1 Tax=Pinibacter soli TaxID=3044211 RepID=A0ABT6R888_9BACT|nr:hypothetical protein [Pinibacter soli]MDI3318676.1 hypothetical protein [Pinibacter soli]